MPRISRLRAALKSTIACAALAVALAPRARAQLPILLEGVADGEFWSTTAYSNLLTRNAGRASGLGRLQLWTAIEPLPGLVFFGQGEAEGGRGSTNTQGNSVAFSAEQYGVRYALSPAFVIDAGKLQPIVGNFAARRFSNRNPLIGTPDGYSLEYPMGVEVSGERHYIDYRVAMVSLPPSHEEYVPSPDARLRPAIGGGITPMPGLRIGGSFTVGSYLNHTYTATQLHDKPWSDYDQRVVALDAAYSHGYLETHFEAARASYDVPGRDHALMGYTYYGEAKYTLTPRFFVATRLERNHYPFIRAGATNWTARLTDFVDGEAGVGYRVTASTVVKASVRADRWWVPPGAAGFLGQGGPALAMQVSQSFDAMSWFARAK